MSKHYLNKYIKNEAYGKLAEKLIEKYPDATTDLVKKKINIYRSNFRKEAKKVEDSMRSGIGADDVYTPTWTYYEDLMFLKDQEAIRISTSNLQAHEACDISGEEVDESLVSDASTSNDTTPTPQPTSTIKKRKKQTPTTAMEQLVTVIGERIQNTPAEDQHDHFGKSLAAKLRNIPSTQRIYAEKLNDVIFAAELGHLSSASVFNANHFVMPTIVEPSMSTPNHEDQTSHSLAGYFSNFSGL
ncbi:uncharacterized protein LOC135218239 [Macrobrachium nipponense]|uniref:uncharacterized protein LOC135218239 n=1 Tax=Macrobrachium nipponense TaxID=159736 RepID=UPI0030C86B89